MSHVRRSITVLIIGLTMTAAAQPAIAHDAHDISVKDAWVKVAPKGQMTAVFGYIVNTGTKPISITKATTPVSPMTELHEVVKKNGAMVMQEKDGGIKVRPGGKAVLKPGGNHIMLMGLTRPIRAGRTIPVTVTLSDGSTVTFRAVGKVFPGANESYEPSMSMP